MGVYEGKHGVAASLFKKHQSIRIRFGKRTIIKFADSISFDNPMRGIFPVISDSFEDEHGD